jgi:hypothetical protein
MSKTIAAFLGLLLLAACANPRYEPLPDPILPDDAVKDAQTAAAIANRECYPASDFVFTAKDAHLRGDEWRLVAWDNDSMKGVDISKRTGKATGCIISSRPEV